MKTISSSLPSANRFGLRGMTCMTSGALGGGGNAGNDTVARPAIKGHVLISDNTARRIVAERGVFGVFREDRSKRLWRKTRADILADLSCLRPGDRVFFYDTDDTKFWGIHEVTSRVFCSEEDIGYPRDKPAPYRFGLRPFLPLEKPITESGLFSRKNAAKDFRSIFYKKALTLGKACTHLFPEETAALTEALLMQNDRIPESVRPGSLNAESAGLPAAMSPEFETEGGCVRYEKELEWWLTHHLDSHPECRKIVGDPGDIEVFANYVPITISRSNVDLVVYHRREVADLRVRYKISIIELKKGKCEGDALRELGNYVRWFVRNIVGPDKADVIQPILIAKEFGRDVLAGCAHWNMSERKPQLFTYEVAGANDLRFKEERHGG